MAGFNFKVSDRKGSEMCTLTGVPETTTLAEVFKMVATQSQQLSKSSIPNMPHLSSKEASSSM